MSIGFHVCILENVAQLQSISLPLLDIVLTTFLIAFCKMIEFQKPYNFVPNFEFKYKLNI